MDENKSRKPSKISSTGSSSVGSKRSAKGKAPKPPPLLAQKISKDGDIPSVENPYSANPTVPTKYLNTEYAYSPPKDDINDRNIVPLYPTVKQSHNGKNIDRNQKLLADAKRALKPKPPLPPTSPKNSMSSMASTINTTVEPEESINPDLNQPSDSQFISSDIYQLSLGSRSENFESNLATSLSIANGRGISLRSSFEPNKYNIAKKDEDKTKLRNIDHNTAKEESSQKNASQPIKKASSSDKFSSSPIVKIDSLENEVHNAITFGSTISIKEKLSNASIPRPSLDPWYRTTPMNEEISIGSSKKVKNIWDDKKETNIEENSKLVKTTTLSKEGTISLSTSPLKTFDNNKSQGSDQKSLDNDRNARLLEEAKKEILKQPTRLQGNTSTPLSIPKPTLSPKPERNNSTVIRTNTEISTPIVSLPNIDNGKENSKLAIVKALHGDTSSKQNDVKPNADKRPRSIETSKLDVKKQSSSTRLSSTPSLTSPINDPSPVSIEKIDKSASEVSKPNQSIKSLNEKTSNDDKSSISTKSYISTVPSILTSTELAHQSYASKNEENKHNSKTTSTSFTKPPLDRKVSFKEKEGIRRQEKPPNLPTVGIWCMVLMICSYVVSP